jgi:L-alanine-DL-glutamate epimerase-like enolase superfamily enzyme
MKIKSYRIEQCVLPDEDPEWKFALQAYPKNYACLVTLEAEDGTCGTGYAAAFPHLGATAHGMAAALERLCGLLVGREAEAIEANLALIGRSLQANNAAKSGIDCALFDLQAHRLRVPMYQLFGGKVRDAVPLTRILAIKRPAEMAERAQRLVDKGYKYVKLKLAGDVREDIERVRAVRRQVGDAIRITIDPNQSYGAKDAIACIRGVEEFRVDMVEQPVESGDLQGLAEVTRACPIPIEADESAASPEDVYRLARERIVDAISMKVSKMGGLRNVLASARICEAAHLGCRMGATVGSQLLAAHALHVVAALPNIDYACELAEFDHLTNDPYEGLKVVDGEIRVPDEIGSGVRRIGAG